MTKTHKSYNPIDYPQFDDELPIETIQEKVEFLKKWMLGYGSLRSGASSDCFFKIINLVERRRVYFHVFHGINMSEWNEISLYCFWIIKLQPFYELPPTGNIPGKQANEVNARIATRLLLHAANKIRKKNGKERTNAFVDNLIHAFRYRDISKEAIMAIFEALIGKCEM